MQNQIISRMIDKGIKVSKKRIWIVEEVYQVKFITNVEEFWMHLRSIRPVSWATTYNTLRILSEYGIIEKINKDSKAIAYRLIS